MTTRKMSQKQRLLTAVEESDKFELIRAQQHEPGTSGGVGGGEYIAEGDEAERALLEGGSNDIHNHHHPTINSSCM